MLPKLYQAVVIGLNGKETILLNGTSIMHLGSIQFVDNKRFPPIKLFQHLRPFS